MFHKKKKQDNLLIIIAIAVGVLTAVGVACVVFTKVLKKKRKACECGEIELDACDCEEIADESCACEETACEEAADEASETAVEA